MKSNFLTKPKHLFALVAIGFIGSAFIGCSEEIDERNRYTSTGETIADYLNNRPELYSKFCYILEKAKIGKQKQGNDDNSESDLTNSSSSILKTLTTYGSYTCFAPVNEAIDEYLREQYELWESTKGTEKEEDTGIYSPELEELSDSMATVIAKNHIIETAYFTTDIKSDGAFPENNINNRLTSISFANDEEGNLVIIINDNAKVLEPDVETTNGIVHTVDKVVAPSNKMICDQFALYEEFSLHSDLITKTGLDEVLRIFHLNPDYENYEKYLTSPQPMSTAEDKSTKAPYPETYDQLYTLLAVPNYVYEELGLHSFEDIEEYAESWYGNEAHGDYKNPKNAVYKLISYHILDRGLIYDGNRTGGFIMNGYNALNDNFKSNDNLPDQYDRYDYFETLHPYSIIKVTRPKKETALSGKLVVNYAQEDGTRVANKERPEISKHINAVIMPVGDAKKIQEDFVFNTTNGYIWVIDRLLIYDEDEMKGNILDERMRWDASSLFPELTNNNVRWHQRGPGFYEIYIPDGYCKRLKIKNSTTYPFYLTPHETSTAGWANYQGDEILIDGVYNFEYRLPYVPAGTYEIRFGFGFSSARGICQFYLDGQPTGIPVDMLYNDGDQTTAIGKTADFVDSKFTSQEEIDEFDKSLRNRGWMKGAGSVILDAANGKSMRESPVAYRRIVTQTYLSKGEHWLGFKDVTKGGGELRQCSQDYLEIVPKSIITNPSKPEDKN